MALSVVAQLRQLTFIKQLAFAYLVCERLYPNYSFFSNKYRFGDPNILRQAADFILHNFFEEHPDKTKMDLFRKLIDKNTPDPGEFRTGLASSALDACSALRETFEFIKDKEPSRLEDISTFATDSVSMHIMDIDSLDFNRDKDFQKKIDEHPLMQREINIQLGIIAFLKNIDSFRPADIQTLLSLQDNNNKGSLNL
jgi:uncharacterized protein YjaG (DUF416 family)